MAVSMIGADQFEFIDFSIHTQVWTRITHINTTVSFYAQPIKYQPYVSLVSQPGEQLIAEDIDLLKIVVFKDVKMQQYIRGKVLYMDDRYCKVLAIDFGFVRKNVRFQDMFEPNEPFPVLPLAIHCQLDNCNYLGTQDSIIAARAFNEYTKNQRVLITVVGIIHGKYLVKVRNNCGEDVEAMMSMTDCLGLAFSRNEINVSNCRASAKHFFKPKSFPAGIKLNVKFLAGKSLDIFYVTDLEDSRSSSFINEMYQQHLDELDDHQFREELPVSAFLKESGCFVRGIIKSKSYTQERAEVYLVDLGRTETIAMMDLRVVPNRLFTVPIIAIKCKLEASLLADFHYQKYLSPGQSFYITVIKPSTSADESNLVKASDE